MNNIFVFGGGELSKNETLPLDRLVIKSLNKTKPNVLFIPTASKDATGYMETFKSVYESLGANVSFLCLLKGDKNPYLVKDKIFNADLIYVGGGNTKFMIELWKKYKVDKYLIEAYKQGITLSGISAGGICWFNSGYSDSEIVDGVGKFTFVGGLHLIDMDHNPHADEKERESFLNDYINKNGSALCLDNLTLVHFEDGIIKNSYATSRGHKVKLIKANNGTIEITDLPTLVKE